MPIRKIILSPAEQRTYFGAAQKLREAGMEIDIPEEWERQTQRLEVSVCPVSGVHVLGLGMTVYALYVRLTSLCSNLVLDDIDIGCAWDGGITLTSAIGIHYQFGKSLEFEFGEVLNHRIENGFRFRHVGVHFQGWILGLGIRPVPLNYANHRPAPLILSFIDQRGETHRTEASAIVYRSSRVRQVRVRPMSLYERESSSSISPKPASNGDGIPQFPNRNSLKQTARESTTVNVGNVATSAS